MRRFTAISLGVLLVGQVPMLLLAHDTPEAMTDTDKGKMGEEMMAHRLDHMSKKLDLTAAQKDQVKGILQDEMQQMKPLHEQMKTIHEASDAKIKAVLTDDQKKKFDEWKTRRQEKMHKHMMKGDKPAK